MQAEFLSWRSMHVRLPAGSLYRMPGLLMIPMRRTCALLHILLLASISYFCCWGQSISRMMTVSPPRKMDHRHCASACYTSQAREVYFYVYIPNGSLAHCFVGQHLWRPSAATWSAFQTANFGSRWRMLLTATSCFPLLLGLHFTGHAPHDDVPRRGTEKKRADSVHVGNALHAGG